MRHLTRFLDDTSMYRLLVLYLGAIFGAALILGLFDKIPEDPSDLALSLLVVVSVSETVNWVFARAWGVPANRESTLITALLIVLLLSPVSSHDLRGLGGLASAAVWAVASKYLLAWGGKHIFNPAALGVALTAALLDQAPTWWAGGSMILVPVVALGGIAVVIKLRRADIVLLAVGANILTAWVLRIEPDFSHAVSGTLLHTPILFLALTMLTEPLTRPQGRWQRWVFSIGVGILAVPVLPIGDFYMRPELAILAGNVFAFLTAPRDRLILTLKRIEKVAANASEFVFAPNRPLRFRPGQYLEWTLALRDPDLRGNRRYFTIASAPDEAEIRLGVKVYAEASAFKRRLTALKPGERVYVSQLAGHFVLPHARDRKVALIAGGIGITPFRSMVQDMLNRAEPRPMTLLYGNATTAEIAYRDVFDRAAQELGLHVVYSVQAEAAPPPGIRAGLIDEALIRAEIPDFAERLFYVSGPPPMVRAIRKTLRNMGVRRFRIRTDFFPGIAS